MLLLKSVPGRIFLVAVLLPAIPLYAFAPGQSQERVLDWYQGKPAPETKVLEIVEIKVEGKPVSLGEPFRAGKDWFKTLIIRVRNISDRPVEAAVISFNVSELEGERGRRIYDIAYAIQRVGVSSSGTDIWDYVPPGDVVNLAFTRRLLKSKLHEVTGEIEGGVRRVSLHPVVILTYRDGTSGRGGFLIN